MIKKIKKILRDYFLGGLIVIVPGYISFYIVIAIIKKMDRIIEVLPPKYNPETYLPFKIPGLGAIATILLILLTGFLFKNIIGRSFLSIIENRILKQIPLVGTIYRGTKQILAAIFSDTTKSFKEVALIEYPKKDSYALAFVTGYLEKGEISSKIEGERTVALFVPTTPNPTSGFLLLLPENKIKKLNINVETAFKIIISGGVLTEEGKEVVNKKLKKQ